VFKKYLEKIFRRKKNEVSEQFRILHNEKLRDLYRSPGRPRWAGYEVRVRERDA
jgi:hypothetical protein